MGVYVTNGGLRGVWPPFPEIILFRPFFCLLRPCPDGPKSTWQIQKNEEKGLFFLKICLNPISHFLEPLSLEPPIFGTPNKSNILFGGNFVLQTCRPNVLGCALTADDRQELPATSLQRIPPSDDDSEHVAPCPTRHKRQ